MTELAKTFDPAAIEKRWYAHWEEGGLFRPDRPGAEPWTIVNPPPNVTGSLHIGHALDNTLQDILARHARLQGKDALWVVGTDHAGIATQMVVERQMAAKGEKRTDLTREAFVEKVWAWKEESGGEITQQLRRLGCSMDWANERFTMDPGFSKAVLKVFVDLHKEGLLYRDKRLVNWDPGLGTAISDLEVETREVKGSFWRLRYPLGGWRQRSRMGASSRSRRRGPRRCSPTWRSRSTRPTNAIPRFGRQAGAVADHGAADPDRRGRTCRSRTRIGRGEDHAGA